MASGAARCPFLAKLSEMPRLTEARYADGVSEAWQGADPMEVARTVFDQDGPTAEPGGVSALFTTWGQFLDHDLSLTPEGHEEMGAFGDHAVHRSEAMETSGEGGARAFGNAITWQIDGSMIYGSNEGRVADVRAFEDGKLRMSEDPASEFGLLPLATEETVMAGETSGPDAVFLAGDVRANENPNLLSLHTLWAREHNHWAARLAEEHPDWTDDQLFDGARQIVEFELQKITYDEWLPLLVGNAVPAAWDVAHDPDADGEVSLEFSTAAFRFGHTLVASSLERTDDAGREADEGHLGLMDAFFDPGHVKDHGIDSLLRGQAGQSAEALDAKVVDDLNFFLATPEGVSGFSLPALNLMRGADHGMGSYLEVRAQLLGDVDPAEVGADDFHLITADEGVQADLRAAYGDVRAVDLWVGGLAEDHAEGGMTGPLFRHILSEQFGRTAAADETWQALDPALGETILAEARGSDMKAVILRNTEIDALQDDPFLMEARALVPTPRVEGTSDDDAIDIVLADVPELAARDGDDAVTVRGGSEIGRLDLGAGDDALTMTSGRAKRVEGGDGDDALTLSGPAAAGRILGGSGDDDVALGPRATAGAIRLGAGDDTLRLSGGAEALRGGAGEDRLIVQGPAEVIFASDDGHSGRIVWEDGDETTFRSFEEVKAVPCFVKGTSIETVDGPAPIESIRAGTRVMTLDRGPQEVAWVGRRTVAATGAMAPVRLSAGTLGLARDLWVSPQHRMLLRGPLAELATGEPEALAPAAALVGRAGVARVPQPIVTYVHLLFERHEIVLAEGAPSESFHPGAAVLSAMDAAVREELLTLFPELESRGYGPAARAGLRAHEARLIA